ncbi:MAG TPA: hypothetical protein VIL99_06765, partial [Ignavibacteria bacterium]
YNYDEIKLTIVFNLDGIFFEAHYVINFANGEVAFEMDKPMICVKDFMVPADIDSGLAELIKEKMKTDNRLVSIDDERFDKYYSEKFLPIFIDYVEYLENLTFGDKCKECIHLYNYNLNHSDGCKELFVRNRYHSDRKADED